MKEISYVKRDGSNGFNYKLEEGDEFVFKKMLERDGKYGKMYSAITSDDKIITLTKSQGEFFGKFNIQPGTAVVCEEYTNAYGTFVGLRAKNREDLRPNTSTEKSEKPQGLPPLKKSGSSLELTADEETCINQLVGNEYYDQWKLYAKTDVKQMIEALDGIANDIGVKLSITGTRADAMYNKFLQKC